MTDDKTATQTISRYILETGVKNRIKTAALISNNFAEIKKNIIISFSDKLYEEMNKKLPSYTINSTLKKSYLKHGSELTVSKKNWSFLIRINNQESNNLFFLIGISPKLIERSEVIDNIIHTEMTKNYKQGLKNSWWIHCSNLDKFERWTQPEILAILHENPQEAIDYFVEEFGKILAIVEPLIDKHPEVLIPCQPAG